MSVKKKVLADGSRRFAELPKGSFYTLVMRDHEGTEQILFEDVPFWELRGVGDAAGEDLVDPFTLEVDDS